MRRLGVTAVVAAVVLVGVYALAQLFVSRDDAGVSSAERGPGTLEPDRGSQHPGPAESTGVQLPTSGPHRPDLVTRDGRELTADQALHALELGNVLLVSRTPERLRGVQREVAGPFDAELAAAGQAVIVVRGRADYALAWRRRLEVRGPDDPALREFAEAWLGKGASGGR